MNPDDLGYYYSSTDDTITIDTTNIDPTFDIPNVSTYSIGSLADDTPTEIEIQQSGGETLKVAATIRQQKYEIEALTDIIKEMVKTKNFDVELDIEKRVEQKKFLKRLGED
jgi:hypothetical protein